ncbi:hypothetical protein DCAR_0418387 [Daucus carota subsp. sativus]|uniref:RING-type domain-containing protein n=1 Tax=Daucus carota subsp. sativus TaxID=79200 RepID=A0A165ZDA7_DAUCS|nr:hypothetical protein DCAR_0418387 [Daucus carota subsp. sativus]
MGLSPYPTPVDAGVLCLILASTARSVSTVMKIVCFILRALGIVVSWDAYNTESPTNLSASRDSCLETSIEEFRSQIPAITYDSLCYKQLEHECTVCLTEFKAEAVINHLSCGHVFHKICLEKWLNYRNPTCPNCRKYMVCLEDVKDTCSM